MSSRTVRRGRGREAEDASGLELLQALAEREVGGTEVVAPLRDAVRLVHRHQRGRHDLEQAAELVAGERLRRGQDEQRAALGDARQTLATIGDADRAVEANGRHAELLHLQVLVLEQREERRDHDRGLRQEQRGQLVAQRLAAAGRHDEQRVAAGEDRRDGPLLLAMQTRDAEALARDVRRTSSRPTVVGSLQVCALQASPPCSRSLVARPIKTWRTGFTKPSGLVDRVRSRLVRRSRAGWASERVAYALGPVSVSGLPYRRGKSTLPTVNGSRGRATSPTVNGFRGT